MRALLIGGTGNISSHITRQLAEDKDWEVWLLNRGNKSGALPDSVYVINADINDEELAGRKLDCMTFDVVADFIAYTPDQVERDIRLFEGRIGQYIFISTASAYQKPLSNYLVTESTPLANPFWQYSRDKIACEDVLIRRYRENGFPVTIVRPSHTYGDYHIPVSVSGTKGPWPVLERMRAGKPVIVNGDGASLWTVTHSSDFARAFIGLMGNAHAIGEAVQITSDETLSWDQIYKIIGRCLGVEPELVHIASDYLVALRPEIRGNLLGDKSHSVVFDNTKLKRLVPGFHAGTRFDQGVAKSIANFMDNPALRVADPAFDQWCDKVIAEYLGGLDRLRSTITY